MDMRLHCPECDHEVWLSETQPLSKSEFEWGCPKCTFLVGRAIVPE